MNISPAIVCLGILIIIAFVIIVNLNYYNRPTLKFHNDEIDGSDVQFTFRNILGID